MGADVAPPRSNPWLRGALAAGPIVLGYLPIGFAFGVLAAQTGLGSGETLLMSLLVYAGASQFIAVGLLAAGVSPLTVVLATLMVNLRHLPMAASLAPHLRGWSRSRALAFAFQLTDETFAVHSARLARSKVEAGEVFGLNLTAHAAWVVGTAAGWAAGGALVDIRALGLDFALPAMFLALLVLQVERGRQWLLAGVSGAFALALYWLGMGAWALLVATLAGATLGLGLEWWEEKKS